MSKLKQFYKLWFVEVSRGYTLLMSVIPWLVAFCFCLKTGGNFTNGIIALLGLVCAHLGTNVFDDFVDHKSGIPKQKCKTAYIDEGRTSINKILFLALAYFAIAAICGLFFTIKLGSTIVALAFAGGLICLSYPKLNNICLGELALGLAFGPLMFLGISYVMLAKFDLSCLFISFPVSIFIVGLLLAHALMDFDFDKSCGKKTFCTVLNSKEKALSGLFILLGIGYISTIVLICAKILSPLAFTTFLTIPLSIKLFKGLHSYITTTNEQEKDFMKNFVIARNLAVIYNLLLLLGVV